MTLFDQTRLDSDIRQLRAVIASLDQVVVAFSGGADSALLAYVANEVLGSENVRVVTAVSPSLAGDELTDCQALADEWELNWHVVETDEMANAAYRLNDTNRCFHCKDALMDELVPIAEANAATIVLGVNLDDLDDHRPGQQAALQHGSRFPFVEAGLDKAAVRAVSHHLGLRTWDKPAAACLASRIPYGTQVSVGLLSKLDRAEAALHRLGFHSLRVRHYDDTARIEVPLDALSEMVKQREAVVAAVQQAGYKYVTVDLEGLRSGNLNT